MKTHSKCSKLFKTISTAGLLMAAVGFTDIANAAQGCGFGMHRNYWGRCVFNHPGPWATPAYYYNDCWRNRWGQLRCYYR